SLVASFSIVVFLRCQSTLSDITAHTTPLCPTSNTIPARFPGKTWPTKCRYLHIPRWGVRPWMKPPRPSLHYDGIVSGTVAVSQLTFTGDSFFDGLHPGPVGRAKPQDSPSRPRRKPHSPTSSPNAHRPPADAVGQSGDSRWGEVGPRGGAPGSRKPRPGHPGAGRWCFRLTGESSGGLSCQRPSQRPRQRCRRP